MVLLTSGIKVFLGGLNYAWFIVCIFELVFFHPKSKNLFWSWYIDEANMLNNLIIPRNKKMLLAFVTFGNGSGCFSTNVWLPLLGLSILIISIIIFLFVSTLDRYYCYPYKLSWWCSVILLKEPGLGGDIQKTY